MVVPFVVVPCPVLSVWRGCSHSPSYCSDTADSRLVIRRLLTDTLNEAGLLLHPPSSCTKEFVVKRKCKCRVELQGLKRDLRFLPS